MTPKMTARVARPKNNLTLSDSLVVSFLALIIIISFTPLIYWALSSNSFGDFMSQIRDAWSLLETGDTIKPRPNFLYLYSLVAMYQVLPYLGLDGATILVITLYFVATGIILWLFFRRFWPRPMTLVTAISAVLIVISLMIIMPINILTPQSRMTLYFGYIPISPYHNPTLIVLKPFALILASLTLQIFGHISRQKNFITYLTAIVVSLLSILAKPNYAMALVPALIVYSAYHRFVRKESLNWNLLIIGFIVPMLVGLSWQYLFTFNRTDEFESSIIIAPFDFFTRYEPLSWRLFVKFVLSILFPLVVYGLYWRQAFRDIGLNISWLAFGAGATFAYFFSESGIRGNDGNFMWGAMITLFILFVFSWRFLLYQLVPVAGRAGRDWRFYTCLGIYGLHVVSGLLWFGLHIRDIYA